MPRTTPAATVALIRGQRSQGLEESEIAASLGVSRAIVSRYAQSAEPAHAARNAAIRASTDAPTVIAARFGLSEAQISRIRSGMPRPLTQRQEAEQVRAGAWRADCMDDEEWPHWLAMNPMGLSDALVAARPCTDCPLGFAAEMRAEGRCNGTPGWRPPIDDEEDVDPPELIPLITLADLPVTPPEEPMESPAAAPAELPIVVTLAESRIHALEELQSAAREAQDAIQEHHAAETALAKAEEIHELALRRLSRVQDRVRDVFNPPATDDEREVASPAERRHEQLLHGHPPDSSTADPHPNWTTAGDGDPGVAPADVPNGVVGGDEPVAGAPEPVTSAPPRREPVAGESKQDAILAAVVRLGGDLRAVAADRNTTPGNVVATLHNLGRRGRLVPEVIVLLPAIFAKYSSVRP